MDALGFAFQTLKQLQGIPSVHEFACERELSCVDHSRACPCALRGDENEVLSDGRVVVCPDGACPHNDVRSQRRADDRVHLP